jgi:hypothetical protein
LQQLWLNDAAVTDEGILLLRSLKQLLDLQVFHTQVTDAGVAELQKALPNCQIMR